jgi:hypothetical protein
MEQTYKAATSQKLLCRYLCIHMLIVLMLPLSMLTRVTYELRVRPVVYLKQAFIVS